MLVTAFFLQSSFLKSWATQITVCNGHKPSSSFLCYCSYSQDRKSTMSFTQSNRTSGLQERCMSQQRRSSVKDWWSGSFDGGLTRMSGLVILLSSSILLSAYLPTSPPLQSRTRPTWLPNMHPVFQLNVLVIQMLTSETEKKNFLVTVFCCCFSFFSLFPPHCLITVIVM